MDTHRTRPLREAFAIHRADAVAGRTQIGARPRQAARAQRTRPMIHSHQLWVNVFDAERIDLLLYMAHWLRLVPFAGALRTSAAFVLIEIGACVAGPFVRFGGVRVVRRAAGRMARLR